MKVLTVRFALFLVVSSLNSIAFCQEESSAPEGKKSPPESTIESKAAAERAPGAVGEEGASLVYRPRGTGRTTGHILTLSVTNTGSSTVALMDTGKPGLDALAFVDEQNGTASTVFGEKGKYENGLIDLDCAMAYIPAGKKYQDYVATGVQWPPGIAQTSTEPDQFGQTAVVSIDPSETIVIPVEGYCANIRQPPVPQGSPMSEVSEWISPAEAQFPTAGQLDELGIIVQEAPPEEGPYLANIPPEAGLSKDQTLIMSINPQPTPYIDDWEFNSAFAAFLFDALHHIRITAEVLQAQGAIHTPYSSGPPDMVDKERETLIQQTFWLYASVLRGDNYTKDEFSDKMAEQYESNTGKKIKNAPPQTVEKLESGVDDFWGSFELVGASAKVLKSDKDQELEGSLPPGTSEKLKKAFESTDLSGVKTHTDGSSTEATDDAGAVGYAAGNKIEQSDNPGKEDIAEEVAHTPQSQNGSVANNADLESVESKEDFDNWRRKKYDDYVIEREINGKSHKEACEAIGVEPDSDLGKALKRVRQNEKK